MHTIDARNSPNLPFCPIPPNFQICDWRGELLSYFLYSLIFWILIILLSTNWNRQSEFVDVCVFVCVQMSFLKMYPLYMVSQSDLHVCDVRERLCCTLLMRAKSSKYKCSHQDLHLLSFGTSNLDFSCSGIIIIIIWLSFVVITVMDRVCSLLIWVSTLHVVNQ